MQRDDLLRLSGEKHRCAKRSLSSARSYVHLVHFGETFRAGGVLHRLHFPIAAKHSGLSHRRDLGDLRILLLIRLRFDDSATFVCLFAQLKETRYDESK